MSGRDAVTGPSDPAGSVDLGIDGLVDAVPVGQGGFGAVYRARQPRLNRIVAVKVLTTVLDPVALDRFEREGFAMGTVAGHPNILQVFGVGTTDAGRPYLLMPYLAGGSLDRYLPLSWQVAVRHAVQLCGALETAHAAGVLHRDLKPANILQSEFGEPLIADFGIARLPSGFQTASGMITASVPYAPPEILDGGAATPAADVYSLAATVHCLISGQAPFAARPGEQMVANYLRIVRDPPPDLRVHGVPDPVCRVLESALAKHPADRPGSAAEFGRMLQQAQREVGEPETAMRVASMEAATQLAAAVPAPTPTPEAVAPTPAASAAASEEAATRLADVTPPGQVLPPVPPPDPAPAESDPAATVGIAPVADTMPAGPLETPPPAPVAPPRRPGWIRWAAVGVVVVLTATVLGYLFRPEGDTSDGTSTGDGGTAQAGRGQVTYPSGLAVEADGTLLVSDQERHRLIRVTPAGAVTEVAGTGSASDAGDGGPAAKAGLDYPGGVVVANGGDIYLTSGGLVRRIDTGGTIRPVPGFPADFHPSMLAIWKDDRLFAADRSKVMFRDAKGVVHEVIDAGVVGSVGGLAIHPDGWLAVADTDRNQIVRITDDTKAEPIVGLGGAQQGPRGDGAPALQSEVSGPTGLVFDKDGRLYFSESGTNRVRMVQDDGTLRTVAGDPEGYSEGDTGDDGPGRSGRFGLLGGPLALDSDGNLFIGDVNNKRVRKLGADGVLHALV